MYMISLSTSSPTCFDHSLTIASWPSSPVEPVAQNHSGPEHMLSQVKLTTSRKLWIIFLLWSINLWISFLKVNQKIVRYMRMITEWVVVGLILDHIRKLMWQLNWPFTSATAHTPKISFQENIPDFIHQWNFIQLESRAMVVSALTMVETVF